MTTFKEMADDFLAQKQLAVVGVSRKQSEAANQIYSTLRGKGYSVYAVNPKMDSIDGDPCYPDIRSIPTNIDGAFIMTRPEISFRVVQECIDAKVPRVWMHENGFFGADNSSVSEEAVELCKENGIQVIAGGCPMMFLEFGHKCMRTILGWMGKLPA